MKTSIMNLLDFERINTLLEGFNKTTGFVTAILDLEGNVLSKSGWRTICTDYHRVNLQTAKKCTISDTVLANKLASGEKYQFYKCLNGLVDVAVPLIINGEHIANLFSGQFFFEKPDRDFFIRQAEEFGFDKDKYLKALDNVPVVDEKRVKQAMDFLLDMTKMIAEMTMQKLEQIHLKEELKETKERVEEREHILKLFVEHSPASIAMFDNNMRYLVVSKRFLADYNLGSHKIIGKSHYEIFPEIPDKWKAIHKRGLSGETLHEERDPFLRADGRTDWVRWEIRPWYEADNQIGGIILFSEVITTQVQDKVALTESENYNRTLFEQSSIGLALTSLEGKLIYINATFANIIGHTVEDAKKLTYWDITPKKYESEEEIQLRQLESTGKYGPYEKEYIHKDGHLVPVRLQGLIIERNGERYIWSSVEDISERKKAERELFEAKEKLSQILNRISDGFGSLDKEWNYTYVNDKLAKNVNKRKEDLLGKNIWKVFPEAVGTPVYNAYIRAMEEQIPIDLEHFYPHFGRWFQHRFYPSSDGLTVFSKDITDSKLAEDNINTLNERLQMLVEAIQELSISSTMDNIIDIVRKSARNLVNADGSTFILREGDFCYYAGEDTISPLWKGQRFPLTECISGWAILNRQSVMVEDIYKDERIPIESYKSTYINSLAISPIRISDPLGAIGAYWANNYKPSEIEIKLLNSLADAAAKAVENVQLIDGLEQKISERTSQLQAANKELETFTYSVSHDLKAPLRGIDGYSKLLSDLYGNKLNDEANYFIETIRRSTTQMNQLIEDLLQYSRLERSNLQIKPLKIRSVVESILKINEEEVTQNNFAIKINVPDIKILADSNGIQIALRNLIENAIKFTKKVDNPEITITLEENSQNWIISVSDNGIGFDMKYSERIFEIFQRLQRAEDFPGTGIGLAMVAKAVQRMNGSVRSVSAPGKGSTFYLEIPKSNQQWNQN